jgi:hypothetical protein
MLTDTTLGQTREVETNALGQDLAGLIESAQAAHPWGVDGLVHFKQSAISALRKDGLSGTWIRENSHVSGVDGIVGDVREETAHNSGRSALTIAGREPV